MAQATKIAAITRVVVDQPESVQLTVSVAEAQMLHAILGEFCADGPTSPVYNALDRVVSRTYANITMNGVPVRALTYKAR